MRWTRVALAVAASGWLGAGQGLAQTQFSGLGTLEFPNSGAPAAQEAFLAGVKLLHSFEFDDAAEAFREAQTIDPSFALAYWGEAMSYNHPLWAEQDFAAARKTLARLGATRAERLARAKTDKEKAYLEAIETLYGEGDKLARDIAYSEKMAQMYATYPEDHEVATLYALSLLGTVRPGDQGYRRQMLAASVVDKVFRANPNHPGAAHFLIHAYDDPEHAVLGLAAADAYAKIAPAAGHANHMPSHMYVQLGMWDKARDSNIAAYESSVKWAERKGLSASRRDFHSLSWLHYAYLQLNQPAKAQETIDWIAQVAKDSPTPRVSSVLGSMEARQIIETETWRKIELAPAPAATTVANDGMTRNYDSSTTALLTAGLSNARVGELELARTAMTRLAASRDAQKTAGREYAAKNIEIMVREVEAVIKQAEKDTPGALAAAKAAVDIEASLDPPSGPPEPIKPSHELYGELLLAADKFDEAAKAFEDALVRMPNRRLSVEGLKKATAKAPGKTTSQGR
jgi:tetratricopeptide (TPR) repeat protein